MIDFDLSRRPVRPSDWAGLAEAVYESTTPEESYWLETKSPLDWTNSHGLGTLSRAILGMANRDPERASAFLEGSGIVIIGLGPKPGQIAPVEVIDGADLESKLSAYLGKDGPRWQPHWATVEETPVLIVEVDAPRAGDPGYTLRKSFGDYRVSQTFVRALGRTEHASQDDIVRLARRLTINAMKVSLDVEVGYAINEPLSKIYTDQPAVDAYLRTREDELLASLERIEELALKRWPDSDTKRSKDDGTGRSPIQAMLDQMAQTTALSGLRERHAEDRTAEQFRNEVTKYIDESRARMPWALWTVAKRTVATPRFWVSNLSDRNFKQVEIALSVEGRAQAHDVDHGDAVEFANLFPKPPRPFGPFTTASTLASLLGNGHLASPYLPTMPSLSSFHSRRDIRNGGSFVVDLDRINLRPGEQQVEIESDLVILIPRDREEDVIVHWRATADNVDAVAEGDFVMRFDGEPVELLAAGLSENQDE